MTSTTPVRVEIYWCTWCPYSRKAMELLHALGPERVAIVDHTIDSPRDPLLRQRLETEQLLLSPHQTVTVPQIWWDGVHIGGCSDLQAHPPFRTAHAAAWV